MPDKYIQLFLTCHSFIPLLIYLRLFNCVFHIFTHSTPAYCQWGSYKKENTNEAKFPGWGGGRAWVKNIWPRNVINLKKNICIMTILVSFSISKSPNQANKKPLPFAHHPEHKWFWQSGWHKKKYCLKQTRKKIASSQVFLLASIRLTFVSFDMCTVCVY